jgi:hypothetical protein
MKINYKLELIKSIYIILAAIVLVLSSCSLDDEKSQINSINIKSKTVLVIVRDRSKSIKKYWDLDTTHLIKIYNKLGAESEGKIYGLFIQTNSTFQEPLTAIVPELDTLILQGSTIQRANRMRINVEYVKSFNKARNEFITITRKLICSNDEDWSDVENALILSKQIIEMPNFESWNKTLLILSDMENNLGPNEGLDKMNPIIFKDDVAIAVIRPSDKINLEKVLPGAVKYVTIDDAIESLFNKER